MVQQGVVLTVPALCNSMLHHCTLVLLAAAWAAQPHSSGHGGLAKMLPAAVNMLPARGRACNWPRAACPSCAWWNVQGAACSRAVCAGS